MDDKWKWDQRHGNLYTLRGLSLFLLNLAYAAGDCQLEDETKSLVAALFKEAPGGFYDKALGAKLVKHLFEAQNEIVPEEAYRAFRGRDAGIDALLRSRGFPVPDKN